MLNRIKKKINEDENVQVAIVSVFASVIALTTYTYVCRRMGYEMCTPWKNDEGTIYVKTIHGKTLSIVFPED